MERNLMQLAAAAALTACAAFAQGGFNGPGRYEITNLKSGKVIDLDRNDQSTVIQFSSRGTDNQTWDIQQAGSGYFYLHNGMNGYALEAAGGNSSPVRGTPFNGSPSQQWRIEPGKDGNAIIVNRGGKGVDVPDGTNRDGVRLQIYDVNGDSNQRFIFRQVGGGQGRYGRDDRGRYDQDRDVRDLNDRDRPNRGRFDGDALRSDRYGRYYDDRDRMWKLRGDGVCFYPQTDYRGEPYCSQVGDDRANPGGDGNTFLSIKFFGRTREVEIFDRADYRGGSVRISRDQPDFRQSRGNRVGSFRVY